MNVVIVIDTGFVGGEHHVELSCTVEQWQDMSNAEKEEEFQDAIHSCIECRAEDEEGNIL